MFNKIVHTLEETYKKYYPYVFHRAVYLLKNKFDAEDAASEVFIRMAKGLTKKPDLDISKGAIIHITTHVCIDKWRSVRNRKENITNPIEGFENIITHENNSEIIFINQIINSLDGKLREIAIYYILDGLTLKEISEITGFSMKTIQRYLLKIQKKLSHNFQFNRNNNK